MSTITINGNTYSGNNITVVNGKVIIDGVDFTPDSKEINISVAGDIAELRVDSCNKLNVQGNAGNINTKSGDVEIGGDVSGNVQSMSGDVDISADNEFEFSYGPQSPALRETLSRLDRMKDMGDNWDDDGAEAVNAEAISCAKLFASSLAAKGIDPYFTVAGKNGEVILEYRNNRISAEIEVYGNPAQPQRLVVFQGDRVLYDGAFVYAKFLRTWYKNTKSIKYGN